MKLKQNHLPLVASFVTLIVLSTCASLRFEGFFSARVFFNFLEDNAFLGIAAVGMTFVILSGGIDLSTGAVIGLLSVSAGLLLEHLHLPFALVVCLVLISGAIIGTLTGFLISYFSLAPFLVTLAAMFFARGLGFVLSLESIQITDSAFLKVSALRIPLPGGIELSPNSTLLIVTFVAGAALLKFFSFGRNVYALGSNEASAILMGLPVNRTKILIYALNGACSGLAAIVYTFYTSAGNPNAGGGLELDAISAVVIGGTLLTGGTGGLLGTFVGVLILGVIQTGLTFESTLSSWWTKIIIGFLLFVFIVFQKLVSHWKIRPAATL